MVIKSYFLQCKDDHDSGKGSDSPDSSLGQLNPQHKENGINSFFSLLVTDFLIL